MFFMKPADYYSGKLGKSMGSIYKHYKKRANRPLTEKLIKACGRRRFSTKPPSEEHGSLIKSNRKIQFALRAQGCLKSTGDNFIYCDAGGIVQWAHIVDSLSKIVPASSLKGIPLSQSWRLLFDGGGESANQFQSAVSSLILREDAAPIELLCEGTAADKSHSIYFVRIEPQCSYRSGLVHSVAIMIRKSSLSGESEWTIGQIDKRRELIIAGGFDGVWECDGPSGNLIVSDKLRKILMISDTDHIFRISDVIVYIYSEDKKRFIEDFEAFRSGELEKFFSEVRIKKIDGSFMWVAIQAVAERANNGEALRMAGALVDISERKDLEARLVASNSRFEKLIGDLRLGILVEDAYRQVITANQAFCTMFGVTQVPATLIGGNSLRLAWEMKDLFDDPVQFMGSTSSILKQRVVSAPEEFKLIDGRVLQREFIPGYLSEEYGANYWIYSDITQQAHFRDKLIQTTRILEEKRKLLQESTNTVPLGAGVDSLTNLPNRRVFEQRLKSEMERSSREGTPLALILADIDYFKRYNDTYGSVAGDEVLHAIAKILKENRREYDLIARFGGEEFAVVAPGALRGDSEEIAERFRVLVETWPWPSKSVTVSFGVAILSPACSNVEEYIALAVSALHCSKEKGRNCVSVL
jgi:diguanylate cyclase (GGDEF)-like protein